jgi:UPF0042 nucleotide-binding protein
MRLIIISGRSGSGKSVCLHVLEDMGFYCIDNLPIGLLPELPEQMNYLHRHAAVSIDARNLPADLNRFDDILTRLKTTADQYEVLFFDADDATLLKRFSETRRKHPLTSETVSLHEALKQEQQLLEPIAISADLRIDTSCLNVLQLRDLLRLRIQPINQQGLSILIESFGYKFGVPRDADYVFDVRCLPNPYWQIELRPYTGLDKPIIDFLEAQPSTQLLLNNFTQFLQPWLPQYEHDNRRYMTIAVGCTGGQHRSVYVASKLASYFTKLFDTVQLRHRELTP